MELPSSMPGAISVDELEPAVDNILPRGPLLDTFIRKYDIGTDSVDYRLPTPLPGLAFPTDFPFREYDAMVDAKLAERPDIGAWMKTSFVKVIVASRDRETGELGFSVASGCQITPSHVLTCRHVFEMPASHEFQDIGIMASHNITVSADLLDLSSIVSTPPNTYMLRAGGCSSFRWHGSSKGLDFVVLQSREVLPSLSNTFLRIPKESHWTAGSTFCALGYAGRPDYVTAEKCFTEPFIEYITRLSGKGQTEILPPFLEASCYGWPLWPSLAPRCCLRGLVPATTE